MRNPANAEERRQKREEDCNVFALSTSWNAFRHSDGKDLLFEIKGLGFEEAELSFNLSPAMVKDIEGALNSQQIKIISLHNFCPIPDGLARESALPDSFSMSSQDEEERRFAVKYTKRTIDTAEALGAKAVVLHCGRVNVQDKTKQLIELYEQGLKESQAFKDLKESAIKERQGAYGPFLQNAIKSLGELQSYAREKQVLLGIETRFYYREIPSLEEIGIILDKFKGSNLYYWHDTGHAQVMENLGFNSHRQYLDSYGESMIGMHFHDVSGCRDHQAISRGQLNFSWLRGFLKKDTLKVIEVHHPATGHDVKKSRELLKDMLNARV